MINRVVDTTLGEKIAYDRVIKLLDESMKTVAGHSQGSIEMVAILGVLLASVVRMKGNVA